MESSAPEILRLMPGRLLIAAGESASSSSSLPFGISELVAAADEILVLAPNSAHPIRVARVCN